MGPLPIRIHLWSFLIAAVFLLPSDARAIYTQCMPGLAQTRKFCNAKWVREADEAVLPALTDALLDTGKDVSDIEDLLPGPPPHGFNDSAQKRRVELGLYAQQIRALKAGHSGSPAEEKEAEEVFKFLFEKLGVKDPRCEGFGFQTFNSRWDQCEPLAFYRTHIENLEDEGYRKMYAELVTLTGRLGEEVEATLPEFNKNGKFPKSVRDNWNIYRARLDKFSTHPNAKEDHVRILSQLSEKYQQYFDVEDWIGQQKIDWEKEDPELKKKLLVGEDLGVMGREIAQNARDSRQLKFLAARLHHMEKSGASHEELMAVFDNGRAAIGGRVDETYAIVSRNTDKTKNFGQLIDYLNAQEAARAQGLKFDAAVPNPAFRNPDGRISKAKLRFFAKNLWEVYFPEKDADRFSHLNTFQRARIRALMPGSYQGGNRDIAEIVGHAEDRLYDLRVRDWKNNHAPGEKFTADVEKRLRAQAHRDIFLAAGSPTDKTLTLALEERQKAQTDALLEAAFFVCPIDPPCTAAELSVRDLDPETQKFMIAAAAAGTIIPGARIAARATRLATKALKTGVRQAANAMTLTGRGNSALGKMLHNLSKTQNEKDIAWLREHAPKLNAMGERIDALATGSAERLALETEFKAYRRQIDGVRRSLSQRKMDEFMEPLLAQGKIEIDPDFKMDARAFNDAFTQGRDYGVRPMHEGVPVRRIKITGPIEVCQGNTGKTIASVAGGVGSFFGPCLSSRAYLNKDELQRLNATPDSNKMDRITRFRINASEEEPVYLVMGGIGPVRDEFASKLKGGYGKADAAGGGDGGGLQFLWDREQKVGKSWNALDTLAPGNKPLLEIVRSAPVPSVADAVFQKEVQSFTGAYKVALHHGDRAGAEKVLADFKKYRNAELERLRTKTDDLAEAKRQDLALVDDFLDTYFAKDFDKAGEFGGEAVVAAGQKFPAVKQLDNGVLARAPTFRGRTAVDPETKLPVYINQNKFDDMDKILTAPDLSPAERIDALMAIGLSETQVRAVAGLHKIDDGLLEGRVSAAASGIYAAKGGKQIPTSWGRTGVPPQRAQHVLNELGWQGPGGDCGRCSMTAMLMLHTGKSKEQIAPIVKKTSRNLMDRELQALRAAGENGAASAKLSKEFSMTRSEIADFWRTGKIPEETYKLSGNSSRELRQAAKNFGYDLKGIDTRNICTALKSGKPVMMFVNMHGGKHAVTALACGKTETGDPHIEFYDSGEGSMRVMKLSQIQPYLAMHLTAGSAPAKKSGGFFSGLFGD